LSNLIRCPNCFQQTDDVVYLQCAANMAIYVLKKFIRCKMDLENNKYYEVIIDDNSKAVGVLI